MNYTLAETNQNTFILYDCLDIQSLNNATIKEIHEALAKEQRDDALILIQGELKEGIFYAKMLVLGLDGQFGEFCGNGSLACAAYLYQSSPKIKQFKLITERGSHSLQWHGGNIYSVQLPPPVFDLNPKFISNHEKLSKMRDFTYVEMIEPHLVFNGDLSDAELFEMGRALNADKELFPLGINVNAWHFIEENAIHVKTYERGVQRLTKSCGTGSISCVSSLKKEGTFFVTTPGGKTEIKIGADRIQLKGAPCFFPPNFEALV